MVVAGNKVVDAGAAEAVRRMRKARDKISTEQYIPYIMLLAGAHPHAPAVPCFT
jgi:hypothetical protein